MVIKETIQEKLGARILDFKESSPKRFYLGLKSADLKEAAKILFQELGLRLATATGCDTPSGIEILYHFSYDQSGEIFSLRVLLEDRKKPQIDSVTPVIRGAEWIEREMWELLGINFIGHPNMKHLLLIDDWPEGKYPLRKD